MRTSWPGGFGLDVLYPPSTTIEYLRIEFDLVCVHGLNGDPAHTWFGKGANGKKICWLSDLKFLPNQFPLSRIVTFKYNSRVVNYKSDAQLEAIASSLLCQLEGKRRSSEERQRPLVFLCHSLGGLVVKQAMILQGQTADRVQIQTSTKGIVFLASPHGGSHLAQSLNKLSFLIDSPKHLADVLSVGSKALEKLNNEFQVYYDRRREHNDPLRISSFCEMHRTNGITIVPLQCAKTGLEGEVTFNVEKDHRSICKLTSPADPVFDLICKEIARITIDIPTRRPSCDLDQALPQYHDLPLNLTGMVGRQVDMDWLNDTLRPEVRDHTATAVLWGLGWMGKTHLALHYARRHPSRYRTIRRFNSRSELDLQSSMENFFDYLIDVQDERFRSMASPTQNDKWKAVIQWFEGERNFLIIYDGIEFAPEEFIRYLPQTASGHFIFTSHHSSIQTLGETREIKEMNNKDAIELLLQRSKLETHYANQVEKEMDTLPIVHILDKTPGLIDIAAKYILVNRISLRQYRRTLDEYQRTAQQSLPRDMFKGAFDSLSLALNSLRPQQASMQLLRLFSFLDGSQIDSFLLCRAIATSPRWSEDGLIANRIPRYQGTEGAVPTLIELLREGQAFDAAIAPLMDLGFLRKDPTQQGSSIHFPQMIQNLVRKSLTPEEKAHWARIAIQVVGHAIPEEPNLDPEFETVRARLSPHVYRCIEHAESLQTVELTDVLTNLIGMMLSTVARSHAKLKYLDSLVTQLDDGYYRCQAAKWRAYREFFAGQRDKAERILEDAQKIEQDRIDINGQPENARANGALGDLIMHRMQFLFMQGRISDGERVLGSWSSKFNSTFEGRVALYITTAHAKMLVARKKLDQALAKLETIVEQPLNIVTGGALQRSDLNWATVILSQVYCFQAKYHYVITLLRPQVDALLERHSQCEYITSDFRILLCEAYIGMKQFNDASTALKSLSDDLRLPGQVGNPRAPDQLFEVKVLSARLSHVQQQWRDAVEKWMDALAFAGIDSRAAIINKTFTRTEKNMLALYSLGVARYRQGDKKVGKLYVSIAEEEPEFLAKPHGEIDYARWMGDVREEYRRVSKSPLQRFC